MHFPDEPQKRNGQRAFAPKNLREKRRHACAGRAGLLRVREWALLTKNFRATLLLASSGKKRETRPSLQLLLRLERSRPDQVGGLVIDTNREGIDGESVAGQGHAT